MSATTVATPVVAAASAPAANPPQTPASSVLSPEERSRWADAELLPCTLSAEIEMTHFTVRDLFRLDVDSVLDAGWVQTLDVPLRANRQLIGWAEFEVIDDRLAVRLTELY
ncbi:MAG TPA: FliM/FliN family flagellar motor C-terminal domain-containing protein [Candidatus Baltobacteraceae bacterium]|nr:FliM/FliN family flagellar motor C-terminal domain-containing protein [Candidatus Baltobacteraceae bacterium]